MGAVKRRGCNGSGFGGHYHRAHSWCVRGRIGLRGRMRSNVNSASMSTRHLPFDCRQWSTKRSLPTSDICGSSVREGVLIHELEEPVRVRLPDESCAGKWSGTGMSREHDHRDAGQRWVGQLPLAEYLPVHLGHDRI